MRTRKNVLENRHLIRYLTFEKPSEVDGNNAASRFKTHRLQNWEGRPLGRSLVAIVLDYLETEATAIKRDVLSPEGPKTTRVGGDMVYFASSLCIVGYSMLSPRVCNHETKMKSLKRALDQLRQAICDALVQEDKSQELLDRLIDAFGEASWPIHEIDIDKNILLDGFIDMSEGLGPDFWHMTDSTTRTTSDVNGLDLADPDLDFVAQSQHGRQKDATSDIVHDVVHASMSKETYRICTVAKICFASILQNSTNVSDDPLLLTHREFVNYLTGLRKHELLLCQGPLSDFLHSKISLSEDDADTVLQYLSQVYTESYEMQKSEVAIGVCISTLTDLIQLWTLDGSDCAGAGAELYTWVCSHILSDAPFSSHVLTSAGSLFQSLLKYGPDYGKSLSLPSARTNLFMVLQNSNLKIKFAIGKNLHTMFSLFVLKEHDHILEDVIDRLPDDPDWIEGIAVRLVVLAYLASSWSTLLRRCVYAIFETPGHIALSKTYANSCLKFIASSRDLVSVQDLFGLFASQILYTWLETQTIDRIPFSVFDFSSLERMLEYVRDELAGQTFMRGNAMEIEKLAALLALPIEKLIEGSFAKVTAYCIARDISFPPTPASKHSGTEISLRKRLGKEQYGELVLQNFADIIAIFFTKVDSENQKDKILHKKTTYSAANNAHNQMTTISASDAILPPNQQPSFKAKYLVDQIEYLCHRTSYEHEGIWTPSLYIYVLRKMLNLVEPALGSLHTCSVIRKIRVLVSLAGSQACGQYPLEMTLHALKPFLTDPQCADDAIGIMQYLIQKGASYLAEVPSFVTGTTASLLISIRGFFDMTQDSTTQESQFRATIVKAERFHAWLAAFAARYTSPSMSADAAESFRKIVKAAAKFQDHCNARRGTNESDMFLELLEDERSERNLLTHPMRNSILQILCDSFDTPPDFREDILGQDEIASMYAPVIWRSCQKNNSNTNYIHWCGRILGRAFAGYGHVDRTMTSEASEALQSCLESRNSPALSGSLSRIGVIRLLIDMLQGSDPRDVGFAEDALRVIASLAYGTQSFEDIEQVVPTSLKTAIVWRDLALPPLGTPRSHVHESDQPSPKVTYGELYDVARETESLFDAIRETHKQDPVLGVVPYLLHNSVAIAEEIFPYAVHLALLTGSEQHQDTRRLISDWCRDHIQSSSKVGSGSTLVRLIINAVLYLQTQPFPQETVKADRTQWLDLNLKEVAEASMKCSLYKTALLLLEIHSAQCERQEVMASRRSSTRRDGDRISIYADFLLEIYKNLDEEDALYGIQKPSNLFSVMNQLEYERSGFKALSFRGAFFDSQIRTSSNIASANDEDMVQVLTGLDLNGLSQILINTSTSTDARSVDAALQTARKLETWDIAAPLSFSSPSSIAFRAFQAINTSIEPSQINRSVDSGIADLMQHMLSGNIAQQAMHSSLTGLTALVEINEVLSSHGHEQVQESMKKFRDRENWMLLER